MRRTNTTWKSSVRMAAALAASCLVGGCAVLTPMPPRSTVQERLAAIPTASLPLRAPVEIRWDDHQIPFIFARHDDDAAFALGLVHAHLRLGQMEIYRRIAQGRIAEIAGPLAIDIDHGLRILDFGRAVRDIETSLPSATRAWLGRFVEGVNTYLQRVETLPAEYSILGLEREPWTVADILTFGRLTGTDVNWLVWFNLLKLRQRGDWDEIWTRLVRNGADSVPSFDQETDAALLMEILAGLGRSGSNSLAVGPARSRNSAAIIANDPHLGINLPNTWLIAGLKSPSLHAVGLMAPGLPVFAIGRNPRIAWGGTNMRAAASDLYDVSALPRDQIRQRRETIKVRWWPDREIVVRETPWGPILSDAPQVRDMAAPDLALRWTGHQVSDEIGAMLAVTRARTFVDFKDAFKTFAVPGQNMLYADVDGNIGQVMAVRLPVRHNDAPSDLVVQPESAEKAWRELQGVKDLPISFNPERGYLVSANNRPAHASIPIGWFFSPNDRVQRMSELLEMGSAVDVPHIADLQQDVYMSSSVALRDLLVRKLDALGVLANATKAERAFIKRLRTWDGYYRPESKGAVAFETFRNAFTEGFYVVDFGDQDWAAFTNASRIKSLLIEDIERADATRLKMQLAKSLRQAAADAKAHADWGSMHRLALNHPLALLPIVGKRFRFAEYAIGGGTDTLMKTSHGATGERHQVRYGSNARHISDLSDMDQNHFVILGGQDGWFNSSTFLDQVPLWLAGEYIRVPLRPDTVNEEFSYKTTLNP